jgi:hypothetical protein
MIELAGFGHEVVIVLTDEKMEVLSQPSLDFFQVLPVVNCLPTFVFLVPSKMSVPNFDIFRLIAFLCG